MSNYFYHFLDYFFIVFHTVIILFNVLGWTWKKTRFWNFITLNLTAFSWFVLGIWYGWGYCFCTDWHWEVRNQLGLSAYSNSYVSLLIYILTGYLFPQNLVDLLTLVIFLFSYAMSLYFQIKKLRERARLKRN